MSGASDPAVKSSREGECTRLLQELSTLHTLYVLAKAR
jgi:hypothetical protein